MKYLIILGDGMADEPIPAKDNKTPLQAAHKPHMDRLAQMGRCGMLSTIPEGFLPGSEVANLSVLGYDVAKVLEGRGSLEAASMGVPVNDGEMVMRCNLICIQDDKIKNHSAGHISTEEADTLIHFLDRAFAEDPEIRQAAARLSQEPPSLFTGISYRHLLKIVGGNKELHCNPPHDFPGQAFRPLLITPTSEAARPSAELLNLMILRSQELLKEHPINLNRMAQGKDPANSIWPWSPGYRPQMQTLIEKYPIRSGSVISAVDLIRGIGVYAGLDVIHVEGATGLFDTNYEGKIEAALKALEMQDFVFLHIEASDEAGHEGNFELKTKTIEYLDSRVVKTVLEHIEAGNAPLTVALLPDHPTPCAYKTHTNNAVPFVIYKPNEKGDEVSSYDEFEPASKGAYGTIKGDEFMKRLFE